MTTRDSYPYTCPVCQNEVELTIDKNSCPFQWSLIGQCKHCNLKVDILQDDWERWEKEKNDNEDKNS